MISYLVTLYGVCIALTNIFLVLIPPIDGLEFFPTVRAEGRGGFCMLGSGGRNRAESWQVREEYQRNI